MSLDENAADEFDDQREWVCFVCGNQAISPAADGSDPPPSWEESEGERFCPDHADATLAVDCKRWKTKLNVRHVETFVSMLDDIGADLGMLITSAGYSANAKIRAGAERGVRTEVLTLAELERWAPAGTVHVSYRVPAERGQDAWAALVLAGLRVREDRGRERVEDQVILEAFRYVSGDAQPTLAETAAAALTNAGLGVDMASSGTSVGGGTPGHRWLEVTVHGHRAGLKILASTEAEVADQLDQLAITNRRVPREALDVMRPPAWPVTGLFGLPANTS